MKVVVIVKIRIIENIQHFYKRTISSTFFYDKQLNNMTYDKHSLFLLSLHCNDFLLFIFTISY